MSAAVLEGDERVQSVSVDGLALLKIVKHCQEALPQMVTGSLLGLNVGNGVLEITHAFPFPESNKSDLVVKAGDDGGLDDDAAGLDGHEFQMEMMKMLREVNVDNNCVGWYQSMYLGTYSTSALLENQFSYQTDLSPNAVVVLYDPMQTSNGTLALKCYRLTEEAVELKKTGKNTYLDPKKIFEEVPVNLSNPGLVRALLADVADGRHGDTDGHVYGEDTNFDRLDLSTNPYLEKHLEFLSSWVDDLAAEQMKVSAELICGNLLGLFLGYHLLGVGVAMLRAVAVLSLTAFLQNQSRTHPHHRHLFNFPKSSNTTPVASPAVGITSASIGVADGTAAMSRPYRRDGRAAMLPRGWKVF
mmetsp:Transcript_16303/g.32786  ORF Transcript_16303/g.32786 Transcript_16303/m.32786 type:complete len:358 (+) Transcript_16303:84-1157(+)